MTTANFDETPPPAGFRRPADYYSSPPPQRLLPKWATFGCGGLSAAAMLLIFGGGWWMATGGITQFMDLMFGLTMGEMRGMYTADVTPAHKETFEKEIDTLRDNLRSGRINVGVLNPVLQAMQKTTKDEKLNPAEIDQIVTAARKASATSKKK